MCPWQAEIRTQSQKKTWYSSQAATERVQKLRVEYWEKIKHIDPKNLVFLDETGILLGVTRTHHGTNWHKSILTKTILSLCKSHSNWRN